MTTAFARSPREDPAVLARDYLWLAKRGAPAGTAEHARLRKLRAWLLVYGERFESVPVELDSTPGPALDFARYFGDPAELVQSYRATVRGESLLLRCNHPLPAGTSITFSFRKGRVRRIAVVVVARGSGTMAVQPYRQELGPLPAANGEGESPRVLREPLGVGADLGRSGGFAGLDGLHDLIARALARRIIAPAPGAVGRRRH